jgi:DNA-directed RNA polymerase subunit L
LQVWSAIEKKGIDEGWSKEVMEMKKRDFLALDADRHYKKDSFDFVLRSIGIYDEGYIVARACALLVETFRKWKEDIDADEVKMYPSSIRASNASSMENSWDVVIEEARMKEGGEKEEEESMRRCLLMDSYSMGCILDHLLYTKHVEGDRTATFCGFAKFHPHNKESVLRVALRNAEDAKTVLKTCLSNACNDAIEVVEQIAAFFRRNEAVMESATGVSV